MRIFLIGFMGVGKTTLGRMIASTLGLPFIDMDQWISKVNNISISEIFAHYGEAYFRKLEYESMVQIVNQYNDVIIATGGGFPCHENNMHIMKSVGTSLYLKADSKPLAHRLAGAKTVRPLIAGKKEKEIFEYISQLLEKREPFYLQADYIVPLEIHHPKLENYNKVLGMVKKIQKSEEE